jgi:3-dehydroquinate synthase
MTQTLSHETVRVDLGERSYDIVIGPGLIARAGAEIGARKPGIRCAVITDRNVAATHLDRLMESLAADGIEAVPLVLEPGEKTKRFDELVKVCDHVLGARLERGDAVVALGGGVIGDLSGFAAGIVRRGMSFIQVPTSLLAQVDSSVGGKTGINSSHGKNLIGVFHQPDLVLADTDVLDTLPIREFRAGYAEVAKYGLIDRPEFFAWLEQNWREVFSGGAARIRRSPQVARRRPTWWRPTSVKRVRGRCSISVTPLAMRWKQPPITMAAGWSMARGWRSGWCWRTSFRRG